MQRFDYRDSLCTSHKVNTKLKSEGIVLINNMPCQNESLLNLAKHLGRVASSGIGEQRCNIEDQNIHRIEALESPLIDPFQYPIISTTNLDFELHTDDFCKPTPIDIVLLHCYRPATCGGESLFVDIDSIVTELSLSSLAILSSPSILTPFGWVPVIQKMEHQFIVRYNMYDILKVSTTSGYTYPQMTMHALNEFKQIAVRLCHQVRLASEDCLVLNNKKMLHGRNKFTRSSMRLLKRLRLYSF